MCRRSVDWGRGETGWLEGGLCGSVGLRLWAGVCVLWAALGVASWGAEAFAGVRDSVEAVQERREEREMRGEEAFARSWKERDSVRAVVYGEPGEIGKMTGKGPRGGATGKVCARGVLAVGAFVASGLALSPLDRDMRGMRGFYFNGFRHHFDDYLQFSPLAGAFVLKASGLKSRSSWGEMSGAAALSSICVIGAAQALKYSVRVERPDGSARNSFPSGHTSFAFMGARLLDREFGQEYGWVSVLGYGAATATGIGRIVNNRHWLSDVLVGAGIGMLSTEVGYALSDWLRGKRRSRTEEFERAWRWMGGGSVGTVWWKGGVGLSVGAETAWMCGECVGIGAEAMSEELRTGGGGCCRESAGSHWATGGSVGSGRRDSGAVGMRSQEKKAGEEHLFINSCLLGVYGRVPLSRSWELGGKVAWGASFLNSENDYGGWRIGVGANVGLNAMFRCSERFGFKWFADYRMRYLEEKGMIALGVMGLGYVISF